MISPIPFKNSEEPNLPNNQQNPKSVQSSDISEIVSEHWKHYQKTYKLSDENIEKFCSKKTFKKQFQEIKASIRPLRGNSKIFQKPGS
ncbi:MAG: hypothetical protein S4CHLAM123_04280 [Chlamydiales bacterium]|nr:hypothetical protein [Chlamydiales bacterium]